MDTDELSRITSAERVDGGVVITFADRRCALYSGSLLQSMLFLADQLEVFGAADDDEV